MKKASYIILYITFFCCCSDRGAKNKTIDEVAGNAEVATFMKNFEGRGDLTDTTHSLTPSQSLQAFKIASDIKIETVLSEPKITQPVFITFDPMGRLWVVQYNQYPYPEGLKVVGMDQHVRARFNKEPLAPPSNVRGADKITMFEDTDNDGTFDKSTDVITGLNLITSVAFGRGQIWVLNPPFLLAYPDADHNGIPDGEPVVHLKGFGIEDTHAVANNLRLGPDGWLYGAQGSTCTANITSENSKNVQFNGQAIWRYHPERKIFEVYAEGGGNTFDVEIDEKGRLYSGDNGTSRGQYYKQGAYFIRNLGKHGGYTNPYAFGHLDNMQLQGEALRFTHAFVKYNGNALPHRFDGKMIAINPLQSYVQLTRFEQNGSTFKTIDEEKIIRTTDHWFRPVDITTGPDGNVYVADWYDSRISHVDPRDTWDKSSGRIYRIMGQSPTATIKQFDLNQLDDAGLLKMLSNNNIWFRQQAVNILYDRKNVTLLPQLKVSLQRGNPQLALESLWAINACGGFTGDVPSIALKHQDPFVRMWAVRLIEDQQLSDSFNDLVSLARTETNPEVRSQLVATAKRLPSKTALALISNLLLQDDSSDPDIPMQTWWAIESIASPERAGILKLFDNKDVWKNGVVKNTILSRLVQRYVISGEAADVSVCANLFQVAPGGEYAAILFNGLQEGLRGRNIDEISPDLLKAVKKWKHLFSDETLLIDIRRGNKDAIAKAKHLIEDEGAPLPLRLSSIRIFGEVHQPSIVPVLTKAAESSASSGVKQAALLALENYENIEIGEHIVKAYPDKLRSDYDVRDAALSLFASRSEWAMLLINAIERERQPGENFIAHTIDKNDVPGYIVRQMKLLGNTQITAACERLWPETNPATAEQKNIQVRDVTGTLSNTKGDKNAGHALFIARCGTCHRLFDEGRAIAPDLTGYDRKNLRDLLINITDPSAYIREGYETWHIVTANGRTVIGTIRSKTKNAVTVQPFTGESVTIGTNDVRIMEQMNTSMMPERLLDGMTSKQIADLFSYLMK